MHREIGDITPEDAKMRYKPDGIEVTCLAIFVLNASFELDEENISRDSPGKLRQSLATDRPARAQQGCPREPVPAASLCTSPSLDSAPHALAGLETSSHLLNFG